MFVCQCLCVCVRVCVYTHTHKREDAVQIGTTTDMFVQFSGFFWYHKVIPKAYPREALYPLLFNVWMFFCLLALLGMPYLKMDPCPKAACRLLRLLDWRWQQQADQAASCAPWGLPSNTLQSPSAPVDSGVPFAVTHCPNNLIPIRSLQ